MFSLSEKSTYRLILALILAVILLAAILWFNNRPQEHSMKNKAFESYKESVVGVLMAQLDYADEQRAVFHYGEGLFVYDVTAKELSQRIDLGELALAPQRNDGSRLSVTVSADGKTAFLSSVGPEEDLADYENYFVDLDSGRVRLTHQKQLAEPFTGFLLTTDAVPSPEGWCDGHAVQLGNQVCYLTVEGNMVIGNLRLVFYDVHSGRSYSHQPLA